MPSVRSGRQPVFRCGRSPTGSSTRRTGPRPLIPTGMKNDAGAISQELQHAVHVLPLQPPRRLRARAVPPAAAAAAQLQQLLLGRGGPAAAHAHGARCRVWTALLSPVSQPGPILDTASSLQGEYRASLSIRTSTGGQRLHLLTTILDPVRTDGKTDVVLGGGGYAIVLCSPRCTTPLGRPHPSCSCTSRTTLYCLRSQAPAVGRRGCGWGF